MTMLRSISTLLTLLATSGCALVAGTSDYEPCGEGEGGCGDGGGSSSNSSNSSSSSGGDCLDLSIEVSGNVEVFVDGDDGLDVDDDEPRMFCLPAGQHTIAAFCDQSGGEKGAPVAVIWGNAEHCNVPGESCTFTLQKDESFAISPVEPSDCP